MKSFSFLTVSVLALVVAGVESGSAQTSLPMIPYPFPQPCTNGPSARIVTPGDGSVFLSPMDVLICATTACLTDAVASVEFFAGTNSLGVVTNTPIEPGGPEWREAVWLPFSDFCFNWTNTEPGAYSLTVVSTDRAGNSATSAPVDVSIVTNLPPRVLIAKPRNDEMILGPTNIEVCAFACQPGGGSVTQVEFFAGTNSIGVVSNTVFFVTNRYGLFPIRNDSYCLTWSDAAPGAYVLTAVATDNDGTSSTSQPVDISIVTNLPPRVRIDRPGDGETYFAPATVEICASTRDRSSTVASVEFFAGTNSLGIVTNGITITNREGIREQFHFAWDDVADGNYTLMALATANDGGTATSAPVNITVLEPPPPSVRIHTDGRFFEAPASVWICSEARHFVDPVASVQYFAGTNSLGISTNAPFFCFHWTNVPAGAYALTATATDVLGTNVVSSRPVDVTVLTNTPPWWRHGMTHGD